jgi:hypothetical protein
MMLPFVDNNQNPPWSNTFFPWGLAYLRIMVF